MAFAYFTALINHTIMGYNFPLMVPYQSNQQKNQKYASPVSGILCITRAKAWSGRQQRKIATASSFTIVYKKVRETVSSILLQKPSLSRIT